MEILLIVIVIMMFLGLLATAGMHKNHMRKLDDMQRSLDDLNQKLRDMKK